jgi:hypothetical protein
MQINQALCFLRQMREFRKTRVNGAASLCEGVTSKEPRESDPADAQSGIAEKLASVDGQLVFE